MNPRMPCFGNDALRSFCGGFMKPLFAGLLLCTAALDAVQASVSVPRHLITPGTPRIEDPDMLVQHYLQAVDRGELEVFGQKVDRSMLVPVRVEYVYELSDRTMRIRIFSNLKQPLPVPNQHGCEILAVSAVIEDGSIIEIESHIWTKP